VALPPDEARFALTAEFFVLIVDTAAIVLAGLTVSFSCLLLIRRCGAEQGQKQLNNFIKGKTWELTCSFSTKPRIERDVSLCNDNTSNHNQGAIQ